MLRLIPGYHPIYRGADPELLLLIDEKIASGRAWAAFTHTAAEACRGHAGGRIDRVIVHSAITQLGRGVSGTGDVIVDRCDDLATVRALRELAAREPGVLVVSIAPGSHAEPAVVSGAEQHSRRRIRGHGADRLRVRALSLADWEAAGRPRADDAPGSAQSRQRVAHFRALLLRGEATVSRQCRR